MPIKISDGIEFEKLVYPWYDHNDPKVYYTKYGVGDILSLDGYVLVSQPLLLDYKSITLIKIGENNPEKHLMDWYYLVPSRTIIRIGKVIYAHPVIIQEIKKQIN